jgi:hypothetical protein
MNQRIQELLIQSEVFNKDRTVMKGVTGYELNKFAQLIVEKCAGIIESQDVDPSFKLRMSWAVKEHFGVEQ